MSGPYAFSGSLLTPAEFDHQHNFANPCLKRKIESEEILRNGAEIFEDHEMLTQEYQCNTLRKKRQRFCNHQEESELFNPHNMNGEFSLNYVPNGIHREPQQGCNLDASSLTPKNLEVKDENEQILEMDMECERNVTTAESNWPPNLQDVSSMPQTQTSPCSRDENGEEEGSPAREFLEKHRPEYQMHCIPSYCHPGGLWDVMLEVYHGL